METFIAKFAVYNLADLRGFVKSLTSQLGILLDQRHDKIFILLSCGIVFVSIVVIYFLQSSNATSSTIRSQSKKGNIAVNYETLLMWRNLYGISDNVLLDVFISETNKYLKNAGNNINLLCQPETESVLVGLKLLKPTFKNVYAANEMIFESIVLFSNLRLGCAVVDPDATVFKTFSLNVNNFTAKFVTTIKYEETKLLQFSMRVVSGLKFELSSEHPTPITLTSLRNHLLSAVYQTRATWTPHYFPPQMRGSYVEETLITDIQQHSDVRTMPKFFSADGDFHLDSENSKKECTSDSNLSTMKLSVHSKSKLFGFAENSNSDESLKQNKVSPVLLSNDDANLPQVVLAHNTRLRQSMIARQSPRSPETKIVRSASCYGEEGVLRLIQEKEVIQQNEENDTLAPVSIVEPPSPMNFPVLSSTNVRSLDKTQITTDVRHEPLEFTKSDSPASSKVTESNDTLHNVVSPVHGQKPTSRIDISPSRQTVAHRLASKKLLIKVVKAEGVLVKGTSGAYCVVELDEPYQRHSTHCSLAGQLFWDQHLLFDLNTNSKRLALELFELGKRKKSVSKGRVELLLSTLLFDPELDVDTETNVSNLNDTIRRRIPICDRGNLCDNVNNYAKSITNQCGYNTPNILGVTNLVTGQSVISSTPTITAEFNFMEKLSEEARHRSPLGPTPVQRMAASNNTQLSNTVHSSSQTNLSSAAVAHSSSVEFHVHNSSKESKSFTEKDETLSNLNQKLNRGQIGSLEEIRCKGARKHSEISQTDSRDSLQGLKTSCNLKVANLSSPVPIRRAHLEQLPLEVTDDESAVLDSSSKCDESKLFETASAELSSVEIVSPKENTLSEESGMINEDTQSTKPTSSSRKRSTLLATNTQSESLQDLQKETSVTNLGSPGTKSRTHSFANRLKSTRILNSNLLRGNKRYSQEDSSTTAGGIGSGCGANALALLGPSRQLAEVVASMSSLSSESTPSANAAAAAAATAAVASAMSVASTTGGSWKAQSNSSLDSANPTNSPYMSNKPEQCSRRSSNKFTQMADINEINTSAAYDPPVRYVPPAASVAADLPGTFTPLNQQRRSESSNLNLFRIFRHKKKRFRSVGAEKFLEWEMNIHDDLDTISTEGYHRIVQDDDDDDDSDVEDCEEDDDDAE